MKDGMLSYMAAHPEELDVLIEIALSDKQPYAWRAAFLLSNCIEENDPRVADRISEVVAFLPKATDSQKRDLFKVISMFSVRDEDEGLLFEFCIENWCRIEAKPSVRWRALSLALQIAAKHSALLQEIKLVTSEPYLETLSPGIRSSIRKTLEKELRRIE